MSIKTAMSAIAVTAGVGLCGCGNSSSPTNTSVRTPGGVPTGTTAAARCAAPAAPVAISSSITDNIPSDYDSTATPTPTAKTTINFTVLLPARCPGDVFPLILHSHGYSGTRVKTLGPDGTFNYAENWFDGLDTVVRALPYHDYVVISYDERGHGVAAPGNAAHNARIIDPAAETQDAVTLLDWAWCHSATAINADPVCAAQVSNATAAASGTAQPYIQSFVQQEDQSTHIPRDIRVGSIGLSYGGGYQMPLSLLDARLDTIIPNGTWNNLIYSLLPGDGVKLGFASLLSLLAEPTQGNVNNTPLIATLQNLILPSHPGAAVPPTVPNQIRSRIDLGAAASSYQGQTRAARDADELLNLFYSHGAQFFQSPTRDGKPINPLDNPGYVSTKLSQSLGIPASPGLSYPNSASRRAIPALFVQGNRDTLFNITEAYFNYRYYKDASGSPDVRLLTTEGGHMNPFAGQIQGTANCGGIMTDDVILAWFDEKLKGLASATYAATPQVCISVTPTPTPSASPQFPSARMAGAPTNNMLVSVLLDHVPFGNQSGAGAIAATKATLAATVSSPSRGVPVFVPVTTITVANAVLAGVPTIDRVSVKAGSTSLVTPIAYVGVGIIRNGTTILVDDQATPFAAIAPDSSSVGNSTDCATAPFTDHCHSRGTNNDRNPDSLPSHNVLLPGVGETLQIGDQVGFLFYENQIQYVPASNATTGSTTQTSGGQANPYSVTLTNPSLPIFVPTYAGLAKTDANYPGFAGSAVSCGKGYNAPPLCP